LFLPFPRILLRLPPLQGWGEGRRWPGAAVGSTKGLLSSTAIPNQLTPPRQIDGYAGSRAGRGAGRRFTLPRLPSPATGGLHVLLSAPATAQHGCRERDLQPRTTDRSHPKPEGKRPKTPVQNTVLYLCGRTTSAASRRQQQAVSFREQCPLCRQDSGNFIGTAGIPSAQLAHVPVSRGTLVSTR